MKKTNVVGYKRFWFLVDGKPKFVSASSLEAAYALMKRQYPTSKIEATLPPPSRS